MTHGSLFSGIGGFDRGFQLAGIPTVWHAEKEPFCQAILKTHFPEAQLFDDVAKVTKHSARAVDILSGGFPCQDLSVAGKRAGLGGSRSGLFWEVVRIVGELRPTWFVLENVPGLFSSGEGRDFAVVLNALDELGYGLAWRVLNSQFFGVAQRRRRVFIVGRLGKPCPEAVLFEPESGSRDFAPSREARQDIAVPLTSGLGVTGSSAGRRGEDDFNIVASPLGGRMRGQDDSCADNVAAVFIAGAIQSHAKKHGHAMSTQQAAESGHIVLQDVRGGTRDKTDSGQGIGITEGGPCYTLGATEQHGVAFSSPADTHRVRDFTELPSGMDSARYRALGNAVTANVAEWIGRRIMALAPTPTPEDK